MEASTTDVTLNSFAPTLHASERSVLSDGGRITKTPDAGMSELRLYLEDHSTKERSTYQCFCSHGLEWLSMDRNCPAYTFALEI